MFDAIFPKHWTTLQRLMWLKTNALARAVYEIVTGNPVSFTAKAAPLRQLQVAFSPVQNLNGYDAPWPAGGGANKFDISTALVGVKLGAYTGAEEANANFITSGYIPMGENVSLYLRNVCRSAEAICFACYDANKTFIENSGMSLSGGADRMTSGVLTTVAGTSYVRIVCANTATEVACNYPSSVTTYSPYSNICPISGWDSLTVEQTGKNLFDKSTAEVGKWLNVNTGTEENTTNLYSLSDYIPVKAGQTYTMGQPNSARRWLYDANKNPLAKVDSLTFTPSADGYVRITIGTIDTDINTFMVVMGNSLPADYVPYNPLSRSISISLGETVYSGWVDVVTGVGEVTMASVDLGELSWTKGGTSGAHWRFSAPTPTPAPKVPAVSAVANALCSVYRAVTANQTWTGAAKGIAFNIDGKILIADEDYADATALTTALTGQTLVYELATPIPIQLTPQEVESLAGDNTMWTDAASLEVTYRSN